MRGYAVKEQFIELIIFTNLKSLVELWYLCYVKLT